jgi:hypothetical protein
MDIEKYHQLIEAGLLSILTNTNSLPKIATPYLWLIFNAQSISSRCRFFLIAYLLSPDECVMVINLASDKQRISSFYLKFIIRKVIVNLHNHMKLLNWRGRL